MPSPDVPEQIHTPPPDGSSTQPRRPPEAQTAPEVQVNGKPKRTVKEKKTMLSDIRAETLSKFPWHKYPEATEFLCGIKDQLLRRGPDGKRVRGMSKLKEKTRDELLHWWDGHEKEGRNKGDMHSLIQNFFKNRLQLNDWDKYDGSTKSDPTTLEATADPQPERFDGLTKNAGARLLDGLLAPLLQAIKGRARSASAIWADHHPEKVEKCKASMPRGPGNHQKAIATAFIGLSEEERALWQARADEEKDADSEDPQACFKNQTNFPRLLAKLIESFIGFSPKQIGMALVDFHIAMRTQDGRIERDHYTVGLDPDDESFADFRGGPPQSEVNRWKDFADLYLPANPMWLDDRLEYAPDGLPKLPLYDRTWSTEAAADILQVWFQHLWDYSRQHGEAALPLALDWVQIDRNPDAFMPQAWLNHGIRNPDDIPFYEMPVTYHRLFQAQDSDAAFRWRSSQASVPDRPPPAAVPATPRRMTTIVFPSPTKATQHAPAPQLPPLPSPCFEPTSAQNPDDRASTPDDRAPLAGDPALTPDDAALTVEAPAPCFEPTFAQNPDDRASTPDDQAPPAGDPALTPDDAALTVQAHAPTPEDPVPTPGDLTTMDGQSGAAPVIETPTGPDTEPDVLTMNNSDELDRSGGGSDSNTIVEMIPQESALLVVDDAATTGQKREAIFDPVGADQPPTKRRRSGVSAIAAETEPTRRSSRVRTGAAAMVSYRVLDGGKEAVGGSSTAASGAKSKKGATGKTAASKKRRG